MTAKHTALFNQNQIAIELKYLLLLSCAFYDYHIFDFLVPNVDTAT